jgi:phospholipase/lecithinase/hemolysin
LLLAGLLLGFARSELLADSFAEIVVFGDSLSDTGNVFLATTGLVPPAPPYFAGRWSDGPIWVEELAHQLQLPAPTPWLAGGTNYAFGYAETGTDYKPTPFADLSVPNFGTQVGLYLSSNPPVGPDTLFVIWCGANDLFDGQTDPSVPVANLVAGITLLAQAGGESFLVLNLPLLGETPALIGTAEENAFNGLCSQFNDLLAAAEDDLEATLGVQIFRFDTAALLQQAAKNPASFGFADVTDPALDPNTGSVVPNEDEYLFWDLVHPTTVGHHIIGDAAFGVLP